MALSSTSTSSFGPWHLGYVDLRAAAALVVDSWIGIRVAALWIGRIPDRLHAKVYLALLIVVFGAMAGG
ncbi:hypothetical protein [Variovorax sp. Root473]|uniref:hypothetical protein n=1 Tax=Variovorax sp. Root473 TaxID=1736541 RepID=UPI000B2CA7CD|nr:hypothetical protein [Variovorax sp. Root473]